MIGDARARARDFLRTALADGERPSACLLAEAKSQGLSERTLRRAFGDVGGRVRKVGFGTGTAWMWQLENGRPGTAQPDLSTPSAGTQPVVSYSVWWAACQFCRGCGGVALIEVAPKTAIYVCQECFENGKAAAWAGGTGSRR